MRRLVFGSWYLVVGGECLSCNDAKNRASGCGLAVGSAQYAWGKVTGLMHRKLGVRATWVQNVFFSAAYTRNLTVAIHTVSVYFQSVIDRLYTVYTGLTKTTTIKLYVYIKGEIMSQKSRAKSPEPFKLLALSFKLKQQEVAG